MPVHFIIALNINPIDQPFDGILYDIHNLTLFKRKKLALFNFFSHINNCTVRITKSFFFSTFFYYVKHIFAITSIVVRQFIGWHFTYAQYNFV